MENSPIYYQRPKLYPKQLAAMFHEKRYGFIEASTKAGKTFSAMCWLLEKALGGLPGQNYYWVAPVYPQAEIVYKRFKASLPPAMYRKNDTNLTLTLTHCGTIIHFKSAEKPDNLYGDDVHAAVIDEASRCREESWHAVRSTLTATNGALRAIGNVKGRRNWFFALCRRAEAGEADMETHRITALDAVDGGVIKAQEIEDARRMLPPEIFAELYMAEPADDGGNPFGLSAIRACVIPAFSDLPVVAWGWDLAKKQDWTVGIGLDQFGNVARFHRWQHKPWLETIREIRDVTGDIPALVDSTGVGDAVLESLQQERMNFEGFVFTSPSKQRLMEGLAVAIQSKDIGYPEGAISGELEIFEYEVSRTGVKYAAPEGFHDDCVCALALAHRRRSVAPPGYGMMEFYRKKASEGKNGRID